MGNKITTDNINPEYMKMLRHIIKLQQAYKKLKSKREKSKILQKTIQTKLKNFDDKIIFEHVSRRKLREDFGKNNLYEIILRNSTLSSFNKDTPLYLDYLNALSLLGNKHIFIKPEYPIKMIKSNLVYDGQWNMDMEICGYGIIYYNYTYQRLINSINSNLFSLNKDNLFKVISGVFENNHTLDNLQYRIFYNNGLTYEGLIYEDKNLAQNNILSKGQGLLYFYDEISSTQPKTNKLVRIKAYFSNDLEFELNSEVIYYFEDFTIKLIVTADFNTLEVFEGDIYMITGVFKGKFLFDNTQNTYSFIKGIFKYKNGNIYQGEFLNSEFNNQAIYYEKKENVVYSELGVIQNNQIIQPRKKTNQMFNFINRRGASYSFNSIKSENQSFDAKSICSLINRNNSNANNLTIMNSTSKVLIDPEHYDIPCLIEGNLLENMIWGDGTYYSAPFKNGKIHGSGIIISDNKLFKALWRYGKLVNTVEQMKHSHNINPHILDYLSLLQLRKYTSIKNSAFFNYFKQNKGKLLLLKLAELYDIDIESTYQDCKYAKTLEFAINTRIIEILKEKMNLTNNLDNIINLISSLISGSQMYLPLVPFQTNGGCIDKAHHYSNIFNPNLAQYYYSNYLFKRKNDIEFIAAINSSSLNNIHLIESITDQNLNLSRIILENFIKHKSQELNFDSTYLFTTYAKQKHDIFSIDPQIKESFINHIIFDSNNSIVKNKIRPKQLMNFNNTNKPSYKLSKPNTQHHINTSHNTMNDSVYDLFTKAKDELNQISQGKGYFDSIHYKYDHNMQLLKDDYILKEVHNPDIYFSLGCFVVENSIKLPSYVVLHNPVKTLAIYISDSVIDLSTNEPSDINFSFVKDKSMIDIKKDLISNGFSVLKYESNHNFSLIELDSQNKLTPKESLIKQNNSNKRLVCLIRLNTQTSHIIKLKEIHHIGKFVYLQLIDQNTFYGSAETTIDINSFLCFGKIIE